MRGWTSREIAEVIHNGNRPSGPEAPPRMRPALQVPVRPLPPQNAPYAHLSVSLNKLRCGVGVKRLRNAFGRHKRFGGRRRTGNRFVPRSKSLSCSAT
jgi:hypothetical protein